MSLKLGSDVTFFGPALPEAFVQHELEGVLGKALPTMKDVDDIWRSLHKALREPLSNAGAIRVRNTVVGPWLRPLGYGEPVGADVVRTREGDETGGWILNSRSGNLRLWSYEYETDLDAPTKRGLNHRFSPTRVAERVLLATGERLGLLTNGLELRLVFSDPARRASFASFSLSQWKQVKHYDPVPDSFRLFVAFARPEGQVILPKVIEEARLKQGQVTKELRSQARQAIEGFIQGILDNPTNAETLRQYPDKADLARRLWRESLIMVYRLLFILRGESGGRETPPFSFASMSLWRNTYSPSRAQPGNLAWVAQKVREDGMQSGTFIEDGLRVLFKMFAGGLDATELHIAPLGGALFGVQSTPLLNELKWGEHGCALLLDNLLRAPRGKGKGRSLMRLSYRDLDVEELGRVYEALLELEPGIAGEPMARLRRAKLEVVVPAAQGEKHRPKKETDTVIDEALEDVGADEAEESDADSESESAKKSKIEFIETIKPNQFYLRVGLGRKSSGSYYTPESFVKFLVQETLGPQCDAASPVDDPLPFEILALNVLDPAMGSGHFLVGACRYLGERLYDACRAAAEKDLWERVPDEVAPYLPGRVREGASEAGFSADMARAYCKRLVAVHCLYGVDKNPLAVELAKVSLWLESFAEGLPLTFLDHRLVCGDSLLGVMSLSGDGKDSPFTPPYADTPMDAALTEKARDALRKGLSVALEKVNALDATVGVDEADLLAKQHAKAELDAALRPFVDLCVAWSGGIMMGSENVDVLAYQRAMDLVSQNELPVIDDVLLSNPKTWRADEKGLVRLTADAAVPAGFLKMLAKGRKTGVVIFPFAFPEVFFPSGDIGKIYGFDVVLGNPPWDRLLPAIKEFIAGFDVSVFDSPTKKEVSKIEKRLLSEPAIAALHKNYLEQFKNIEYISNTLFNFQEAYIDNKKTIGKPDAYRLFAEKTVQLVRNGAKIGLVLPGAFHANEGATGVRTLFINRTAIAFCYSFENSKRIFDIHGSFKFAVLVAEKNLEGTKSFNTAFYLHDDNWLFASHREPAALTYSKNFVETTGGDYLSFVEIRNDEDFALANHFFDKPRIQFGELAEDRNLIFKRELNVTDDAGRVEAFKKLFSDKESIIDLFRRGELINNGYLLLHEGKTFHQYSDVWDTIPSYLVPLDRIQDKPTWAKATQYFRMAFRKIAGGTDERTSIFSLLPPGVITNNSCTPEIEPETRPNSTALAILTCTNSFVFDWVPRQMVRANMNWFIVKRFPIVWNNLPIRFLAHLGTRLVCNHSGYTPLWQEQLGDEWRESVPVWSYPVLVGEDARWEVRSAIDAVVAQAYGLSRKQYAHVLSTFSHKSYPKAPSLCLAKFDELSAIGLDAFVRKYDPYWDVPLVESLPKPVIELPKLEGTQVSEGQASFGAKDMFGNPLETDLFGNVVSKKKKGNRK